MLELEALLFGIEPVTAAVVGIGALVLAPVIGAIDSATGQNLSEGTRNAAKTALVWGIQAFEKAQSSAAEAGESFQDLFAEAKAEAISTKNGSAESAPREVALS
jgi:hypothetical protein